MLKKFLPYIISILTVYFIFVASFYTVCFINKNFLPNLYTKFNTYDNVKFNITKEEINKASYELMDYLQGNLKTLDTTYVNNGKTYEFYSDRSKIHMNDVRNIFLSNIHAHYIAIFIVILLIMLMFKNKMNIIKCLYNSYKKVFIITLIISIICIILATINFDSFFIGIHEIIFSNDYYMLDPNEDIIINLLTYDLFIHIGKLICITFLVINIIVLFILYCLNHLKKN